MKKTKRFFSRSFFFSFRSALIVQYGNLKSIELVLRLFVCCTCYAAVSFMTFGMVFTSTSTATRPKRERNFFNFISLQRRSVALCYEQASSTTPKTRPEGRGEEKEKTTTASVCACTCRKEVVEEEERNTELTRTNTHTHTQATTLSPAIICSAATRRPPHQTVGRSAGIQSERRCEQR